MKVLLTNDTQFDKLESDWVVIDKSVCVAWTEALVCVLGRNSHKTARFYCPQKVMWFQIWMAYYWNIPFKESQVTWKHEK